MASGIEGDPPVAFRRSSPKAGPSRPRSPGVIGSSFNTSGMNYGDDTPPRASPPPRAAEPSRFYKSEPPPAPASMLPPRRPRKIFGRPRRQPPGFWIQEIKNDDPQYKDLTTHRDIEWLRFWIRRNYHAVVGYHTFRDLVWNLIRDYMPDYKVTIAEHPQTLMNVIRYMMAELYGQWNMSDLSFEEIGRLDGSDVQANCEKHKIRVAEIVDKLKYLVKTLQEREADYLDQIMKLEAALAGAESKIRFLEMQTPPEASFVAELQGKVTENQELQSSLRDELDRQEHANQKLMNQMMDLQKTLAMVHQEKIIEVAEGLRDAQLNESLKNAIVQKIKTLSASVSSAREDISNAISEWMKTIESVLEEKKGRIDELRNLSKSYDDAVTKEALNVSNLAQYRENLQSKASFLAEAINAGEDEFRRAESYVEEPSPERSDSLRTSTPTRAPTPSIREISMDSPEQFRGDSPERYPPEHFDLRDDYSFEDTPPHVTSPTVSFAPSPPPHNPVYERGSPFRRPVPEYMLDSPFNLEYGTGFTPPGFKTPWIYKASRFGITERKKGGYHRNVPPGPYIFNTAMKKRLVLVSPYRHSPMVVNIDVDPKPLVQTASGEHFVCDISVDLQEEDQKQLPTKLLRKPPPDTPTTSRTHQISTRRGIPRRVIGPFYEGPEDYFFTDPLPYDSRSPIAALPPPLRISDRTMSWGKIPALDRPADRSASPLIKSQFYRSGSGTSDSTYADSPLAAFDKSFYTSPSPMIKGPSYRQGSSGTSLEFEGSYASSGQRSPGAESISEDLLALAFGRSYDRSPSSPMIKGASYQQRSPGLDSRYADSPYSVHERSYDTSPSPMIKGPSFRQGSSGTSSEFQGSYASSGLDSMYADSPSPVSDQSGVKSGSPMIKGPVHRRRNRITTYDEPPAVTPSTVRRHGMFTPAGIFKRQHFNVRRILGPFEKHQLGRISPHRQAFDRTISWEKLPGYGTLDSASVFYPGEATDKSPSPLIKRSPVLDSTYEDSPSPAFEKSFDKSPSPLIKSSFYRSESETPDSSYTDSPSPAIDRSLEKSPSPMIKRTAHGQGSPGLDSTYEDSPSPAHDRSFGRSPSPMVKGASYRQGLDSSYEDSPSPAFERSFDKSPSPLIKRSFYRSESETPDSSYTDSPSPAVDRSFEKSPSPMIKRVAFGRQRSPALDSTYEDSPSPAHERSLDRSPSPMIKGTSYRQGLDSSYEDSPSPVFERSHDERASPLIRGSSYRSPNLDSSYENDSVSNASYMSHGYDDGSKFTRSPSPLIRGSSYRSPDLDSSYEDDSVFDASYDSHGHDDDSRFNATFESHRQD